MRCLILQYKIIKYEFLIENDNFQLLKLDNDNKKFIPIGKIRIYIHIS